jgi:multiple sugar transport system substrate-binding protein
MKPRRQTELASNAVVFAIATLFVGIVLGGIGCRRLGAPQKTLTLAINSGVEGDALRQAAKDYEAQTGVHIDIAEFPYANLFEKELIDLNSRTGPYDLIMLDDPWFPKFASLPTTA